MTSRRGSCGTLVLFGLVALAMTTPARPAVPGDYRLQSSVVGAGATATAAAGSWRLQGTISQSAVGTTSAPPRQLAAGFWATVLPAVSAGEYVFADGFEIGKGRGSGSPRRH